MAASAIAEIARSFFPDYVLRATQIWLDPVDPEYRCVYDTTLQSLSEARQPIAVYSIAIGTTDQLMDAIPGSIERRKAIFSINSFCLPCVDISALSRVRSLPGSLSL